MGGIESALITKQAIAQQQVAMAMVKQSADMDRKMADILMEAVPASTDRGVRVDMRA